jgi:hypothetical protein
MIVETAAVKNNLVNLVGKAALGDEFTNLDSRGDIRPVARILAEGLFGGVDAGQGRTGQIVDDLCGDMLTGEMDRETRTLGSAGDFLAKSDVTQFAGIGGGPGCVLR